MTQAEIQEDYLILRAQYANINTAISALLGKNKKYTYSNIESVHMAETHSLPDLMNMRKSTREEINLLSNELSGSFVKLKNF